MPDKPWGMRCRESSLLGLGEVRTEYASPVDEDARRGPKDDGFRQLSLGL